MKVLIVEDEQLAADTLERMLLDLNSEIEILDKIDSVKKAVKWLSENEVDLLFLDIHLADGKSFSIFEKVDVKTPIIFTTAYDQYAIKAFKLNSIAYLLKPIDEEELEEALEKYENLKETSQGVDVASILKAIDQKEASFQKRFMVTTGEKIRSILIEEVAYFMGEDKYLYLITKDNKKYIIDSTLTKLEYLLDPERFFRINRKFTISFDSIKEMVVYSKSRVKVELDPPAPYNLEAIVSVDRSGSFKKWLNR
ncbi:MAG: LytTR family DNA-binding domain-containing protein [Flammeovirgaceae bacterium]|nr:LytTR family DNA-binding domain-containing protein [Flammeovirgaceae bacterium]